jgi:threonine aldolase
VNFGSDTTAPAHPAVIAAVGAANAGFAASYGQDAATGRLRALLAATFETEDFDYWLTASGTASNALALSCFCPPFGAVLCHAEAHIERDERGAVEFFSGGGKLRLLTGHGAKVDPAALEAALAARDPGFVHETPAEVLSLTNLTECGTAYSAAELGALCGRARAAGLDVHLDGARFANAVAAQRCSPADMSWRAGVDVLTFGLTKTGAIGCEIIILFGAARGKFGALQARAKRAGHMPPKMRYLAVQAEAMLTDRLWLKLAGQANAAAGLLAAAFTQANYALAYPVGGNEVFVHVPAAMAARIKAAGGSFYPWPGGSHRFVCSWATEAADIDALRRVLQTG